MDNLTFTNWKSSAGTLYQAPIQFQYVTIPSCSGSASLGYVSALSSYTTSNTASFYSFTFTPYSSSSYIMFMATFDGDRNNNGAQEHYAMFIDGTPYASTYLYPRTSGTESCNYIMSGTYTNSDTNTRTFNIRGANGAGWTQYLGTGSSGQIQSNNILIFEYPR